MLDDGAEKEVIGVGVGRVPEAEYGQQERPAQRNEGRRGGYSTMERMQRRHVSLNPVTIAQKSAEAEVCPFAERVLPRVADLWVQASLEQRQRFQQLFPEGIAFDGNGFVGTVTAPGFSYLQPMASGNERVVDQIWVSSNPLIRWLRQVDGLRTTA